MENSFSENLKRILKEINIEITENQVLKLKAFFH